MQALGHTLASLLNEVNRTNPPPGTVAKALRLAVDTAEVPSPRSDARALDMVQR